MFKLKCFNCFDKNIYKRYVFTLKFCSESFEYRNGLSILQNSIHPSAITIIILSGELKMPMVQRHKVRRFFFYYTVFQLRKYLYKIYPCGIFTTSNKINFVCFNDNHKYNYYYCKIIIYLTQHAQWRIQKFSGVGGRTLKCTQY